jgi:AraC-like DNA-binding protein
MLSPQIIRRGSRHIGRFGKDCYYLGIEHIGAVDIRQSGASFVLRPGRGSLYYANEPYELHSNAKSRQFWIELPRAAFDRRFDSGRPPQLKNFDLTRGLGRIAAEFCATLAAESGGLDEASRSKLGEQFMDLVALALNSEPDRQSTDEQSVQRARLRSVKSYIEANLGDPNLSLTAIARNNGISLRYLHHLFRLVDMSASEWLRLRRLQRCHDLLIAPQHAHQSITEIAYSMGFSSSSHFSNLFRTHFHMRPSDVRGAAAAARAPSS